MPVSASPPETIRVLVVDDHPVTREGLTAALGTAEGVEVVAAVASGAEAVRAAKAVKADVVFMDVRMPDMGGIEAAELICRERPGTRIVMLTIDDSRATLAKAMRAGVAGYLLKDVKADELVKTARLVAEGKTIIHPALIRSLMRGKELPEAKGGAALSEREVEILQRIAYGEATKQVAAALKISQHTVKTHLGRIFEKLAANDRAQAVAIAIRRGLVV